MDDNEELDRKTLRRLAWQAKLRAPKIRAETFKSPQDYKRKSKYPEDYRGDSLDDY